MNPLSNEARKGKGPGHRRNCVCIICRSDFICTYDRKTCSSKCRHIFILREHARVKEKKCSECGAVKLVANFNKSRSNCGYPRFSSRCKTCLLKHRRPYDPIKDRIRSRLYRSIRRARIRGVGSDPITIPKSSHINCYYCGKRVAVAQAEQEHVVPISRGGSDRAYNRVWACPECNDKKATKHPNDFACQQVLCFDTYKEKTA
jgi:5-methylcytosine-specific restriction endonuclease McrA